MNMVWQEIEDRYGDDQPFKKYDGFDDAIVAITEGVNECRLAYDIEKMIEIFMSDNDCSYLDASEYVNFNIVNAYIGKDTPIFLNFLKIND
tara:strand:- start:250 stop:522 length:273 start_codon:yes stop_codon:yes gene_type:complete